MDFALILLLVEQTRINLPEFLCLCCRAFKMETALQIQNRSLQLDRVVPLIALYCIEYFNIRENIGIYDNI